MSDLLQELLEAFRVEHKEHLEVARAMFDRLEEAGWDVAAVDLVELHRRIHSLKGAARAVDARSIEALAHRMETVIERCQRGRLALDAQAVRTIKAALDAVEDAAAALGGSAAADIPPATMAAVQGLLDGTPAAAPAAPPARAAGPGPDPAAPPPSAPQAAPAAPAAEPAAPAAGGAVGGSARIDARSLDGLLECSGEIVTATAAMDGGGRALQDLEDDIDAFAGALGALIRDLGDARGGAANALERRMHDIVQRTRAFGREWRSNAWRMRQLGRRLDAQVRDVRMVPAETVFGGAGRTVRDLARSEGKLVRIDVRGLETRADRPVLQALKDPVLHVLRNAVGHGIEPPEERIAAGKPAEGHLLFSVVAKAARLVLRIEDDGRGVDGARVREIAVGRGTLPRDAPAELDAAALTAVLAAPGFSTAPAVTDLSGRGMGLSVVANAVVRMQGEFSIAPRAAGGTRVEISVPIAVTATRLVVVRCGERTWCIPAHGVARLHRVARERVQSIEGRPSVILDDGLPLPLVPLSALLGDGASATVADVPTLAVVELSARQTRVGAVVDALVAVKDGVVRDLGISLDGTPAAGGCVMEDGSVAAVLDVPVLVEACLARAEGFHLTMVRRAEEKRAPTILVVDDSITTRTLEKGMLEANGFDVRISVDGEDALGQLRRMPVDLVISDVEMPRMDGFELLRAMKMDGALAAIPVILVTSRSNEEDRLRGLSLGADAYVVKQRFDQTDLLATIGQLL